MSRIVDSYVEICKRYVSEGYEQIRDLDVMKGCEKAITSLGDLRDYLSGHLDKKQKEEFDGAFRLEELLMASTSPR